MTANDSCVTKPPFIPACLGGCHVAAIIDRDARPASVRHLGPSSIGTSTARFPFPVVPIYFFHFPRCFRPRAYPSYLSFPSFLPSPLFFFNLPFRFPPIPPQSTPRGRIVQNSSPRGPVPPLWCTMERIPAPLPGLSLRRAPPPDQRTLAFKHR